MNRFLRTLILFVFSVSCLFAQDAKQLNEMGLKATALGNFQEARDCLLKAMKLDPNWAEPHFNAAKLLRLVQKLDESKRQLKIAHELEPTNPTYREAWAGCLKDDLVKAKTAKNEAEIKSLRAKVLEVNPEDFDMALEQIKELQKANDNEGLKKLAKSIVEKNRKEIAEYKSAPLGEILLVLAKIELAEKDYKNARDHAQKATSFPIEDAPAGKKIAEDVNTAIAQEADGYLRNAKKLAEEGKIQEALDQYDAGLAIDPGNDKLQAEKELLTAKKEGKDLFAEAKKFTDGKKWLLARDYLEAVVTAEPNNKEAKKLLDQAIAYEADYQKRLGIADPLPRDLSGLAGLADGYIRQGKRFCAANNYKEARVAYSKAQTVIEMDDTLAKLKSEIQTDIDKMDGIDKRKETWEKAVDAYKNTEWAECIKFMETLPFDYDIQLQSYMAFSYWKKGEKDKARDYAHRSLNRQPENNRSKFVLGNLFLEEGDNPSAYKILKEIKDSDPEYPGIDDVLAKATAFAWGPVVIPIVVIALLLFVAYVMYQNLPEYRKNEAIQRGRSYLAKQMFKDCIEELNKIKRHPRITQYDGAVISRLLTQAFLKTAAYDKAIGEAKHLLSISSTDAEAHQWLGFAYLGRRLLSPETLPELLNLYKTEKKNNALVALLGQHYLSQKTLSQEGVDILERWMENEPSHPELLKALGRFYLQKGRSDQTAMKVFQAMLATTNPEPDFLLGIGKMHLKKRDYESCLKCCEQVLSIDVNNEIVHTVLRDCYSQMGKLADLVEIYRTFLAENPYNVAFQKGLTEANKLLEKINKNPPQTRGESFEAPLSNPPDPSGSDASTEIACPHCGNPNKAVDYYCQSCGKQMA
ncbi:MAG: tetratricopeptide repeat protein [Candidatus Riflebacteria bacterium]|nr:tetratricopeptide repeat protein [Candidatus Riflebacteria bacterium]